MKQNNNNRRARGRGPRKPHGMSGGHGKGQGFEGSGHETRVRGNAYQVLEKYLQLARDAGSAGDRVAAENFLQHADHYYRVLSAMNEGQRPRVGGRELSVADVNVQNVSQGLSAAMYGSGGGQGMPGMGSEGGPQSGDDGQEFGQESGQEPGQARQGQDRQGQDRQGQDRHGQDRQGHERQHHHQHQRHNQSQQHGHDRGQGRGQPPQHSQGQPAPSGNVAANGQSGGYGNYAELSEQPAAAYVAPAAVPAALPPVDEQPDYPEELLPNVAPAAPEAAAEPTMDGQSRGPRGPRGRLRGPGRRGPRPAGDAPSGGPESTE